MQIKTRAIVLRTIKYGDAKVIVDMLTEECGRLAFVQNRPRSKRSAVNTRLLQPLTLIEIVFDHRPNASMQKAREMTITTPFLTIPIDECKLSIALFLAEFTYHATRDEQKNVALFRFVADSMMWLDARRDSFANFHIIYMLHLTKFVGFFPNLSHADGEKFFDMRDGCFKTDRPLHDDFLSPADAQKITLLMRFNYASMHLLRMSHTERNRCTALILSYYRLHVPSFPHLKSFDVLREVFLDS